MKGQAKKLKRLARQIELLSNFIQEEDHYEEKKIGDDWYIKSFNGATCKWQVSIFSNQSYKNYKTFGDAKKEDIELDEKFKEKIFDTNFKRPTLESLREQLN
jgi:hypothetical protein